MPCYCVTASLALSRSVAEGVHRGLLLNFVATDAEVQDFEKRDVLPINMTEVAKAIDAKYKAGDFFEDLKKRSWSALCSYTHSAILQLGRRFTLHKMEPSYTDEEIVEFGSSTRRSIQIQR